MALFFAINHSEGFTVMKQAAKRAVAGLNN
jgi:hypothetical protein